MKDFIIKSILFVFFIPIVLLVTYSVPNAFLNKNNADNKIFIWGDSQMYQGIDLPVLEKVTGKSIFSSAKHGAGVYDFLIFSEKVPFNSTVIVALSKPALIRKKGRDRNNSGLSFSVLYELWKNNYSFSELVSIIGKNRKPISIFQRTSILFTESDSIVLAEPLSLFEDVYSKAPNYFDDKQNLFLYGINELKKKCCHIIFLEFPFHPLLKEIENRSILKIKTSKFKNRVLENFKNYSLDTLVLDPNMELMYDLTHLNEKGACEVSMKLGVKIKENNEIMFYQILWRD